MSRKVSGYCIVFDRISKDLGGFREIIKPQAVKGVLEKSDILALVNHSEEKGVLARATNGRGSLQLTVDSKGVKYSFNAPETTLGNELIEGIKRGDIRSSSFCFSVTNGQEWHEAQDGSIIRTITKFDGIYDVSSVYREAYAETTVGLE